MHGKDRGRVIVWLNDNGRGDSDMKDGKSWAASPNDNGRNYSGRKGVSTA